MTGGRKPDPEPGAAQPGARPRTAEPVRTCIGCRERASRAELLRFATVDGRVVADPAAVLPGRGAWLHPRPSCLDRAVARRAFVRAFRAPVEVDPDTIDLSPTWQRSASTS